MSRILLTISLLCVFPLFGQTDINDRYHGEYLPMNYRSKIENSEAYFKEESTLHSSVLPVLGFRNTELQSPLMLNKTVKEKGIFQLFPIANLNAAYEIGSAGGFFTNTGIGIGMNLSTSKFIFQLNTLPYYSVGNSLQDSIQSNYNQDFGTQRAIAPSFFHQSELRLAYKPNHIFTFSGGVAKNWFGEGYRSMLLSDNAAAHPFVKIETDFAGIKYVNLYQAWKDNTTDPFNSALDIQKFASSHYISWNITKSINLSVFETVVWQTSDTLVNRGFDVNYINPIVFYRPVEYGLGSSDNVLIGLNTSYKINNHHQIYGQFILDEFLLSAIQDQSKWWANKFGGQIGYKSNAFFHDSVYFQIEFNAARPFTYSHRNSQHAYGHLNASVAHPIGANFFELVNIVSYRSNKHRLTNKITFASYGIDPSDTLSYGQDIFKSYTLRDGNYGHLMMQGVRQNVLNENLIYEYALLENIGLFLTANYNWRMINSTAGTAHQHFISVGIKSRIWNVYNDF